MAFDLEQLNQFLILDAEKMEPYRGHFWYFTGFFPSQSSLRIRGKLNALNEINSFYEMVELDCRWMFDREQEAISKWITDGINEAVGKIKAAIDEALGAPPQEPKYAEAD